MSFYTPPSLYLYMPIHVSVFPIYVYQFLSLYVSYVSLCLSHPSPLSFHFSIRVSINPQVVNWLVSQLITWSPIDQSKSNEEGRISRGKQKERGEGRSELTHITELYCLNSTVPLQRYQQFTNEESEVKRKQGHQIKVTQEAVRTT